jgi:hypothetical protein
MRDGAALGRPNGLVLAAVLAVAATIPAQNAAAADNVFTVGNYPVEARADNAAAAKEKALAEGQQAAFRSLLKRLVPVTAYPRIKQLGNVKVADLVEGVSVRSERNSSTDYLANLDFIFQPKGVSDLLQSEGIPFTAEQAPPLSVVALWRTGASAPLGDDPAWTGAWKSLDLEHALTPAKLTALKKEIAPDKIEALVAGDGSAIRALVAAYGTELVLLAVAEPDKGAGRLNVILTGRDAVGAFTLKRAYRVDAADPGYANDLAAVISLGVIEGRWKSVKSQGGSTDVRITVEFNGMSQWQDLSRKLNATPGVQDFAVAGLSARSARVTLRFAGGAERLADVLAGQGMSLTSSDGNWLLRPQ